MDTCSECKRTIVQAGPLVRGMCQYCVADKRCYVCGDDATISGMMGMLCGAKECGKADEFRSYQHYS